MRLSRRDLILGAGGLLAASALPAWAAGPASGRAAVLAGPAFGSSWTLAAAGPLDEAALRAAFEAVIAQIDGAMSPFVAGSELSRFNRADTTDWLPLSAGTHPVLAEALRVAGLTQGAFNPTLGPLAGRYGFGPIAAGIVGRAEEIALGEGAMRKARGALTLDLNGIAKGHALDRLVAACRALGLADFMVELGGEVFAAGRHPAGRAWQIGVERVSAEGGVEGGVWRVVALDGAALATSGSAVNAYTYEGRRYAHIIDPATGRPAGWALASVTVAAPTAMTADALATALYAMGPERGVDFARGAGIEALFVADDGRETATAGFEARILA